MNTGSVIPTGEMLMNSRGSFFTGGSLLLLLMILMFSGLQGLSAEDASNKKTGGENEKRAIENYYRLHRAYRLWHEGLFGSRKYNYYRLREYLDSLRGKRIATPAEFHLLVPESVARPRLVCVFKTCRWLKIKGRLDRKALAPLIKKDPALLKKWWRSRRLISVSGVLRKYRLTRDAHGYVIELWLTDMSFR